MRQGNSAGSGDLPPISRGAKRRRRPDVAYESGDLTQLFVGVARFVEIPPQIGRAISPQAVEVPAAIPEHTTARFRGGRKDDASPSDSGQP